MIAMTLFYTDKSRKQDDDANFAIYGYYSGTDHVCSYTARYPLSRTDDVRKQETKIASSGINAKGTLLKENIVACYAAVDTVQMV
jgi:hypothetical protein